MLNGCQVPGTVLSADVHNPIRSNPPKRELYSPLTEEGSELCHLPSPSSRTERKVSCDPGLWPVGTVPYAPPTFSPDKPEPVQHPADICSPLHARTRDCSHIQETGSAHRMALGPEAPARPGDKGRRAFSASGRPRTLPCSHGGSGPQCSIAGSEKQLLERGWL